MFQWRRDGTGLFSSLAVDVVLSIDGGEAGYQNDQGAGAGVVIAGAYGHSRLGEWILGGVTRRLINPANRCSLLSH